jgi:hypothetical protein
MPGVPHVSPTLRDAGGRGELRDSLRLGVFAAVPRFSLRSPRPLRLKLFSAEFRNGGGENSRNRFYRPARASGGLNAVCQPAADHQRDLLFPPEEQPNPPREEEFPSIPDSDLIPRHEQRRVTNEETKRHRKIKPSGIATHCQAVTVVGAPLHPCALEYPVWSVELRGQSKSTRQGLPAAKRRDLKGN